MIEQAIYWTEAKRLPFRTTHCMFLLAPVVKSYISPKYRLDGKITAYPMV